MKSEEQVKAEIRLEASRRGWKLFRNNVGVLRDSRGVPVRYGLANDSAALNKHLKSGDLIGMRPVSITQEMVGKVIGQFVSVECKRPDGRIDPAQQKWADMINEAGGYAIITRGEFL